MPSVAIVLMSSPDFQERIRTEIPEELASDIRASLYQGSSDGQSFLLRLAEVTRVLQTHFESPSAKGERDAHE